MPPYFKPKQPCPSTSQQTMFGYVTLLAAQPLLVCMLGLYSTIILLPPWIGLSHYHYYYCCGCYDYYYNVDYIRRRMEGRAIPSDVLFHSSHLGPEFWVLVS